MRAVEKGLREAKQLLVDYGWIKGDYERECNGEPCYCTLGAIGEAGIPDYAHTEAENVFMDANPSVRRNFDGSIPDWNDVARRRKGQVLQAFDKAIALAHERGI